MATTIRRRDRSSARHRGVRGETTGDGLNLKEAEAVLHSYGIFPRKIISFQAGHMNYFYLADTKRGRYLLRVGKPTKTKEDIEYEAAFLDSLEGLPVPKYLKDREKCAVSSLRGLNCITYARLPGERPKKVTSQLMKEVARTLAKMHRRAISFTVKARDFALYTLPERKLRELLGHLRKNLPLYASEAEWLAIQAREHRLPDSLPSGPIHCDVKPENLLVEGQKLTGIVDFDNCQHGPFLLDLAISITWFCTREGRLDLALCFSFLQAYEQVRLLEKNERENLYHAIQYAYTSHELIDYYVFEKGIITQEYFNWGRANFLIAARNFEPIVRNKKKKV